MSLRGTCFICGYKKDYGNASGADLGMRKIDGENQIICETCDSNAIDDLWKDEAIREKIVECYQENIRWYAEQREKVKR